jgi:hypothetical protein
MILMTRLAHFVVWRARAVQTVSQQKRFTPQRRQQDPNKTKRRKTRGTKRATMGYLPHDADT